MRAQGYNVGKRGFANIELSLARVRGRIAWRAAVADCNQAVAVAALLPQAVGGLMAPSATLAERMPWRRRDCSFRQCRSAADPGHGPVDILRPGAIPGDRDHDREAA